MQYCARSQCDGEASRGMQTCLCLYLMIPRNGYVHEKENAAGERTNASIDTMTPIEEFIADDVAERSEPEDA